MDWPAHIPTAPGCYLFKGAHGQVLYVGKAKDLRARLAAYRNGRTHGQTRQMLEHAVDVEWVICESEADALLLEAQLIASHQPRHNVKLRYSNPYPRLTVTDTATFPRVHLSHDPNPDPGTVTVGPFTSAGAARTLAEDVPAAFGLRTCTDTTFRDHQRRQVPCLLGQIGRCSAPCAPEAGGISSDDYQARVRELIDVIAHPTLAKVDAIRTAMRAAADRLDFEEAARLRNIASVIESLLQARPSTVLVGDVDVAAAAFDDLAGALTVVKVRRSQVVDITHVIADPRPDGAEPIIDLLVQTEEHLADQPTRLVVAGVAADASMFRFWQPAPVGDEEAATLAWAGRLAKEALNRHRLSCLRSLEDRSAAVDELASALDLPAPPVRIECFDISHHGGRDTVSVMVVFEDGVPARDQYRRFRLTDRTDPQGRHVPDDPASIAEVITRRYRRTAPDLPAGPSGYRPGLVLVDGGPAQAAAARHALDELGVSVPVAGLAKRFEDLWVPDRPGPVRLDRRSGALRLCQQLRDEAHRAANDYRVRVARNRATSSVLDGIPGLGPKRRARLLAHTGGPAALMELTVDQLRAIPWLPDRVADAIYRHLHPDT